MLNVVKLFSKPYLEANYFDSEADLFSVFLERGTQLTKPFGLSAMITKREWMFIGDYESLRSFIAREKSVFAIADLHFGAFPELKDVSVTMSVLINASKSNYPGYFIRPVRKDLIVRNLTQIDRNIAGLISPHEIFVHHLDDFKVIEGQPFVYWWNDDFLKLYAKTRKLGESKFNNISLNLAIILLNRNYIAGAMFLYYSYEIGSDIKIGMQTGNNLRFIRNHWELYTSKIFISKINLSSQVEDQLFNGLRTKYKWIPYIKGAADKKWFEPLSNIIDWNFLGCCYFFSPSARYGRGAEFYFKPGIAYKTIGSNFTARITLFCHSRQKNSKTHPNNRPNILSNQTHLF